MAEPNDEPLCYGRGTSLPDTMVLKCPECGSTNIIPETGFITGYKYHCEDCDYVGTLVLEVEERELEREEEEIRKEKEEKREKKERKKGTDEKKDNNKEKKETK